MAERDFVAEGLRHQPPITVDHRLDIRHPAVRAGLDYWRSRCGTRAMPSRADLDPVDMRRFLANVGLLEIHEAPDAARRFRARLAGTEIEAIFGPITGRFLDEALPPGPAARLAFLAEAVIAAARPVRFSTRIAHKEQNFVETEAVWAPLSDDGARMTMLFCLGAFWSVAPDGTPL